MGKFVVDAAAVEDRGYTGIFASGADSMLIRFSQSGFHVDGITKSVNPSVALKMLRNGVESANQFGMVALEDDPSLGEEWNWFGKDLTSHLPNFKESQGTDNTCPGSPIAGEIDRTQVYANECAPLTAGRWNSLLNEFPFSTGNYQMA